MEDDSLIVEESTRKPQSLRSLANYKKKAVDPSPDLAAVYPPTTLPLSPEFMETELGNSKATFIGVDSDLSQIFGSVVVDEIAEEEVPLECDPTSFQGLRKSHQWNENSEMQNEIIHLQTVIEQLKIENQRLETAAAVAESSGSSVAAAVASKEEVIHHLRSEITTLQDQISNLQFDIKERDDQIKRADQSRGMLLSKLSDSDQIRSDKSSLATENENLKNEKRELLQRLSEFEKDRETLSQELISQKEDCKTYLYNVSKLKEENDKRTREVTLLKETTAKQRLEIDHDLSRLENESKRYEEQVRQLQLELSEKSHLENRMRSDLLAAETKMTHFESENMALRRRLADVTDSREREGAQFQIKISSLENEVACLMDDLARTRRNNSQASLGTAGLGGGGYGGGGGYSAAAPLPPYPPPSSVQSSVSPYSVQSSYPSSSSSHYPPSSAYAPPSSTSMASHYGNSSSIGSLSDDVGGYSVGSLGEHRGGSRGHSQQQQQSHQPRSLRGVLEKDSGPGAANNPTSLASLVRGKGGGGGAGASPFATEITSSQMRNFDDLERQLTSVMTEKSALEEELGRLQQRGGRTLKERTRATQIEGRLGDVGKEISKLRRDLSSKPN